MTLRKKTLIIIGVTIVSLILILYVASRIILLGSFAELEEQQTRQNVERALSALFDELSALDTMVFDWAAWDDTYVFIEEANEDYIQSNLVDETFTNPRLNFMLFINSSGQVVFGKGFDLYNEEEVPVPHSLQEHLTDNAFLLRHSDTESSVVGIVLLPEGPMLVASRPILTSEEEGPIRGTLIMGRYLDSAEIERLAEIVHLPLMVHRFNDSQMPPDFQAVRSCLSEGEPILVRTLSEESIAGYALLEDIYGKPGLVLRADMPREVYKQGQASISYFVFSLLAVGLAFGVVTLLLLEKQVLSRLTSLSRSVSSIGASGELSARVVMTGSDELSSLADAINGMLAALEQSEKALRHAQEQLIRREKLAVLGQLAGGVGHELRNPLGVISNAVYFLQMTLTEADETTKEYLEMISEEVRNSTKIVSDLLDLSRTKMSEREEIAVSELVAEVLEKLPPPEEVEVTTQIAPDLPPVYVDPRQIGQVLVNLVTNAYQAMPEGGALTIKTARLSSPKTSEVSEKLPKSKWVALSVTDTGCGISQEHTEKIFEPLFTTKARGIGLGLAVSRNLVKANGGSMEVESEVGQGSTFTVTLPTKEVEV